MGWPKTRFRRSVEKFMHDLRARERGLETELHVERRKVEALEAKPPEAREPVRWGELPLWRVILSRQTWRPVWEIQAFDVQGHMRWYSQRTRGPRAILAARQLIAGGTLHPRAARSIRVRHTETGRTAWYGFIKGD